MKIVFTQTNHIINGIAASLTACNIQTLFWNPKIKPVFDMYAEINPDILVCQDTELTPNFIDACDEFSKTKLVIHGISISRNDISPNLIIFPSFLTPEQITILNNQKINFIQPTTATDIARFSNGVFQEKISSQLLYISDEQKVVLHESFLNILSKLGTVFKLKAIGQFRLPIPEYIGTISLATICNAIASTEIGIDFIGSHTFNYAYNRKYCLDLSGTTNIFPTIENDTNLIDIISHILKDKKQTKKIIKEAFNCSIKHTYFHYASEFMEKLNYPEIAKQIIQKLEKILNDKIRNND